MVEGKLRGQSLFFWSDGKILEAKRQAWRKYGRKKSQRAGAQSETERPTVKISDVGSLFWNEAFEGVSPAGTGWKGHYPHLAEEAAVFYPVCTRAQSSRYESTTPMWGVHVPLISSEYNLALFAETIDILTLNFP